VFVFKLAMVYLSAAQPTKPDAVLGPDNGTEVTVSWTYASNWDSFTVTTYVHDGNFVILKNNTNISSKTYTVRELTPGMSFRFTVTAVKTNESDQESEPSASITTGKLEFTQVVSFVWCQQFPKQNYCRFQEREKVMLNEFCSQHLISKFVKIDSICQFML